MAEREKKTTQKRKKAGEYRFGLLMLAGVQVRMFKDCYPPVLELLATYCTLCMAWDSIELPRTGGCRE